MCPITIRKQTAYELSIKLKFGIICNNAPRHTTPSRQTATSVDESEGLRCHVRAAASTLFLVGGAGQEAITLRVSWVGRGNPQAPRAEQQWWCTYRGLERILRVFARLLGFRD